MASTETKHATVSIDDTLGQLFRIQAGKMTAVLVRILGRRNWEVCEELVQESLLKAYQTWSMHGLPGEPGAWLMTVAKNKAIDWLRQSKRLDNAITEVARDALRTQNQPSDDYDFSDTRIRDDQLRMLFACCDPRLAVPDRVALTLKTCGGLSVAEIAAALMVPEETIRKRVYRAREFLRRDGLVPHDLQPAEIQARCESVLEVLYLMFNEGYKSTVHQSLIRFELCEEAIRLCLELREHAQMPHPKIAALTALMYFQIARFPTRMYADGSVCQLQFQDRSHWNQNLIAQGFAHFGQSAQGSELSRYHLEAAIASHHVAAPRFEFTNWNAIAGLYDVLCETYPSAAVLLNRAIAIGFSSGPRQGLTELEKLASEAGLADYSLYYASLGEFEAQIGQLDKAHTYYGRAIDLCTSPVERAFLLQKQNLCLRANR